MIKLIAKCYRYLSSLVLWGIWWIIAILVISLAIMISFIIPRKYFNKIIKYVCKTLTFSIFLFPRVSGYPLDKLPYPVIFTGNHVSFFDLFISGSILPGDPRGMELKKHFSTPFYGWFISRFGQIPIDVNRKSIRDAFSHILTTLKNKERNIFIMPEGRRTRNGKIGIFRTGAFNISRKSNVPIVPVLFKNLYRHNRRASFIIRPGIIDVVILEPIYPDQFKHDDEMARYVRKKMIQALNKRSN